MSYVYACEYDMCGGINNNANNINKTINIYRKSATFSIIQMIKRDVDEERGNNYVTN